MNVDAVVARILYRWRYQSLALAMLLTAAIGVGAGLIPPFWKSRASLLIHAAEDATVVVDGKPWPHAVYAGRHSVQATLSGGRRAWAEVDLRASQALTLTLPAGLPEPQERSLPPAAPGLRIDQIWWADNTWRVRSLPAPAPAPENAPAYSPTPPPLAGQTVAVSADRVERLSTLDAYAGLADQVHSNGRLLEAVYRPQQRPAGSSETIGIVEVRGWGAALVTAPVSEPLTFLRFSPAGDALLLAEHAPGGGEQVYQMTQDAPRAPAVAVPGRITRLSWRPDGSAVVLHSVQGERLTLTLVRLSPTILAAVIADLAAADYAGEIVPLTWDEQGLLWVVPDPHGTPTLWRAPLATLIPERVQPLEARALTRLADGTLRVAVIQSSLVVIGRYEGDIFIGEAALHGVTPAPDLAGIWQGDELLLQGGGRAWLLHVKNGEQ